MSGEPSPPNNERRFSIAGILAQLSNRLLDAILGAVIIFLGGVILFFWSMTTNFVHDYVASTVISSIEEDLSKGGQFNFT